MTLHVFLKKEHALTLHIQINNALQKWLALVLNGGYLFYTMIVTCTGIEMRIW